MIRVRFAPSPTGYLHIGGARTALFNYLFARHNFGQFILRIEDTDRERSTEEYIAVIIDGLKWLGLEWDEGPFRQTDRIDVYRSYAEKLLEKGKAYHCYCTPEELEERRKAALKESRPLKYDGKCRGLKGPLPDRKPVVRFMMPQEDQTIVDDIIKGKVVYRNEQLDDFIILRSGGTPTYNFVVVIDDVEMKITHVIRGDDHLNNTPKQIHIYRALNLPIPKFAHLPMILGSDKTRLSKRHGATSIQAYRNMGYLPEALVNYLIRLGWSYGDQEVFSREELIEKFDLKNTSKAAAIFNPEKLLWLNSQYIKETQSKRLAKLVIPLLYKERIIDSSQSLNMDWLVKAIDSLKERSKSLRDLAITLKYYIVEYIEYNEQAKERFLTEKSLPYLKELKDSLPSITDFTESELEKVFMKIIVKYDIKLRDLAQPMRVAITGDTKSPGIFEVLGIIGREKTLKRLDKAILTIEDR